MKGIWVTIFLSIFLFGCWATNKIYEESDIVYSTRRLELKLEYLWHDRRSPITYAEQSIIKEISDNGTTYKVYDAIVLTSLSYQLEDKVFIIIDNEVFAMEIEKREYENSKELKEKKEDIATSDSTSISVVTGYSENNEKISRFGYQLPEEVIEKIKTTDQVLFRYYCGPDMLTLTLDNNKLKKLKELAYRK